MHAEFLAVLHHHLHAQADPEKRPAAPAEVQNRLDQMIAVQARHAVGERADARQDQAVRRGDPFRRIRNDDLRPAMLEGPAHAEQVPDAIVDDRDRHNVLTAIPLSSASRRICSSVIRP